MPVSQAHLAPLTQNSPIPACHPYCRSIQNEALCSIHYMALQRPILALQHCMEAVDMLTTSAGGKMAASCSDAAVQTNVYIPHIYLIVQCCYWNMQVAAKCTHSSSMSKRLLFTCALYTLSILSTATFVSNLKYSCTVYLEMYSRASPQNGSILKLYLCLHKANIEYR